jgi:hypothetical protein
MGTPERRSGRPDGAANRCPASTFHGRSSGRFLAAQKVWRPRPYKYFQTFIRLRRGRRASFDHGRSKESSHGDLILKGFALRLAA